MMVAMMSQGRMGAEQHVATMQALHDRHAQSQAQLMQAMIEGQRAQSAQAPRDPMEPFMRGVEFAREYIGADDSSDELGDILDSIAPLAAGFMHQEGGMPAAPPAPPPAPPPSKQKPKGTT